MPVDLPKQSTLAKALFNIYSGLPVVMVDSPPGAGKSTLVGNAVAYLFENTDMHIVVAVATNKQGSDMARRLADVIGLSEDGYPQVVAGSSNIEDGPGVSSLDSHPEGVRAVHVRTVASCCMKPPTCDLMVVDEAYQTTFASFTQAADKAAQVLVVGDPGQIGPVIPFSTGAWERSKNGPHERCPDVLRRKSYTAKLELPSSYRLGPQTVAAISPLYPFEFSSTRPDRHVVGLDGEILAKQIPVRENEFDLASMSQVVDAVQEYVGRTVVEDGVSRELTTRDVAVVVSRNVQVSAVEALLAERGIAPGEVTVGSADRLQGGQWHAVVAVDPALANTSSGHALSSGRLCVMASRHMTHMTWVHDASWRDAMAAADDERDAELGVAVRERLTSLGA